MSVILQITCVLCSWAFTSRLHPWVVEHGNDVHSVIIRGTVSFTILASIAVGIPSAVNSVVS